METVWAQFLDQNVRYMNHTKIIVNLPFVGNNWNVSVVKSDKID